ncbi:MULTISPECIES: hypothetical protein [Proteus]|uniref:Toll/interleukin-1 receptor domain-containing protein n=1 Tax=Proteus penneri TaxID=102862 RepID=A0ABS0W631_9GAMM|nr:MULTISPECIES: hypothetical protein [Proteus]MBJ2118764.1 toll/interleukin-1 receptor domain-containing protein [Proteus penneri]NBM01564.1 hypothetical protein [Proteus sp. G2671]
MYKSVQIMDFSHVECIIDIDIIKYKEKIKRAYLEPLEQYLLDDTNEIFSADKIQEKLFPTIKDNDIFLSHAHADENNVIKLAVYLEKYGLKVFVDSLVWGNAYDLLEKIDRKYCWQEESRTFNYHQRNHTTANVYMILNTALHKMIDQSELYLFLGSETSVNIKDVINSSRKESVRSPWIYSELMFANQVQRKPKVRSGIMLESAPNKSNIAKDSNLVRTIQFDYDKPDLEYSFSQFNFEEWLKTIPYNYKDFSNSDHIRDIDNLRDMQSEKILDSFYISVENFGKARETK